MAMTNVISSVVNIKQDDGNFVSLFPVTTANEIYTDIDNRVKLMDYLNTNIKYKKVDDDTAKFALTSTDVKELDIVKVLSTNNFYFVIDTENLNNSSGYSLIATGDVSTPITFISYSNADITT